MTLLNRSHLRNFHCQLFPEKGLFVGALGFATWLTNQRKWMVGRQFFFWGGRPVLRGELLDLWSVITICDGVLSDFLRIFSWGSTAKIPELETTVTVTTLVAIVGGFWSPI